MESVFMYDKHYFICIEKHLVNISNIYREEVEYIKTNFCGNVINDLNNISTYHETVIIYICGDVNAILSKLNHKNIYIIKELSYNYNDDYNFITCGQVPININNVGVYFRNLFGSSDYFNLLEKAHCFQSLTESNKPGSSYRKGIYITDVVNNDDHIKFNLLRCSTNLDGPTDAIKQVDNEIITTVNNITNNFFENNAKLNHVLAQIYENTKYGGFNKNSEKKAKIKSHSDKTKDMPRNGLMAFCTFYNGFDELANVGVKKSKTNLYDYCYKDETVLTKLRFKLKNIVKEKDSHNNYIDKFDLVLYPNSVFIMSLNMNRLYTHEIAPSSLSVDKLPTRMGYVIRCSKTKAVYKNNQTYIDENGTYIKLEKPTDDDIKKLKDIYHKENTSDELIDYGSIYYSLNEGDYVEPNFL